MRGYLSAILAVLRRWLQPQAMRRQSADHPFAARHIVIASCTRRYPGRSSALMLRQSQGWIAAEPRHSHQDRRA